MKTSEFKRDAAPPVDLRADVSSSDTYMKGVAELNSNAAVQDSLLEISSPTLASSPLTLDAGDDNVTSSSWKLEIMQCERYASGRVSFIGSCWTTSWPRLRRSSTDSRCVSA